MMLLRAVLRTIGTCQWLRLGIRRRIVQLFYPAENSPDIPFSVNYYGMVYRGNLNNTLEWHIYFFGGYEIKEVLLLRSILRSMCRPIVYDVGANLGCHSFGMAKYAERIYAFEPYPPLADRIEKQNRSNSIDNISVCRFALGDFDENRAYFFDESTHNTGTGSFVNENSGVPKRSTLSVCRGDTWASSQSVDLIKIDVEGFEAYVLRGLTNTLANNEPVIVMEVIEKSWSLIESLGGLEVILPYQVEVYEICNPRYLLGVFHLGECQLTKRPVIHARSESFNVLLVPASRSDLVKNIGL